MQLGAQCNALALTAEEESGALWSVWIDQELDKKRREREREREGGKRVQGGITQDASF